MNETVRSVYRRQDMRRLLCPSSVALIGASSNPASLGGRTLANLRTFGGRLYPVNPTHTDIGGVRCYPSVKALPEPPDCVVLAVPQESVAAAAVDCAEAGAGAIVVLASGYAELGAGGCSDADVLAGSQAQQALAELSVRTGMRVVGPNCVGVARQASGLLAAFAEFTFGEVIKGARIGLVSQSGALGLGLSHAAERGASISHILTCGNSCDIDVADYVAWLAEDDDCDVIALAFEGLQSSQRLQRAAELALANRKHIAVCKLGSSPDGQSAVRFHTATAPGDAATWSQMFAQQRMVRVTRIECLMETAGFLAKVRNQNVPSSGGVAVVSGSGGTSILAVDAALRYGLATPQPGARTSSLLRAAIPAFGSARNPCDATAQATRNPQSLIDCADAMLADERYGALVIPWGRSQPVRVLDELGRMAAKHGKPMCIVWMSQRLESVGAMEAEMNPNLALFRSLDGCFDALAQWFSQR